MPERHEVLRQTILHPPYRHPLRADIDCNDPDRLDRVRRHSRAPKLVDLSDRSPADVSLSCEPGAIYHVGAAGAVGWHLRRGGVPEMSANISNALKWALQVASRM